VASERLPSDRMLRRARWVVANPARYALIVAAGLFVMGLVVLDGDVAFSAAMALVAGVGNWLLWRPGGFQARRWTERIAQADGIVDDVDPNWAPPTTRPPEE
jgi:hypothetical protein